MPSIQLGILIHIGDVLAHLAKPNQKRLSNFGMGHVPAAEPNRHLDTIAFLQELLRILDLDIKIIGVDARGHADFFDLRHMLVLLCLFFLFGLFKAELSVIHDLAHRWGCVGRNLHQIHAQIIGLIQGVTGRHDAKLFAGGTNDADFLISDVLIELMVLFADMKHLQQKTRMPQGTRIADANPQRSRYQTASLSPAVRAGPPLLLPFTEGL